MKSEVELALQIADIHEEAERKTREIIEGVLGASALTMSGHIAKELTDKDNKEKETDEAATVGRIEFKREVRKNTLLVRDVIFLLPRYKEDRFEFGNTQVAEARRLQTGVFWVEAMPAEVYGSLEYSPFYIMGVNKTSEKRRVGLILVKAAREFGEKEAYKPELLFTSVSKRDYEKIKDREKLRVTDFTKDEFLKVYDPELKRIFIDRNSPGSLRSKEGLGSSEEIFIDPSSPFSPSLSDETLKRYSVLENLAMVAAKFERTKEFKEVVLDSEK